MTENDTFLTVSPSEVSRDWTLFLDRDGVINKRLPGDYVKRLGEFEFLEGALDAIRLFNPLFTRIVVVTNQQGIGKGIMTKADLQVIHEHMLARISDHGGRVDHVFYCPELASNYPHCRKPNTGMGQEAKAMYPEIDFERAIMVGDSITDMEFGQRLGMRCAFIGRDPRFDCYDQLIHFAKRITSQ